MTLVDPTAKICPDCAEEVKIAARICRYCRFEFSETGEASLGVERDDPSMEAAKIYAEHGANTAVLSLFGLDLEFCEASFKKHFDRLSRMGLVAKSDEMSQFADAVQFDDEIESNSALKSLLG